MKKIQFLILNIVLSISISAQNFIKDINSIKEAMNSNIFSTTVEYKKYLDNQLSESTKATIYVKNKQYKISIANVTKINNEKVNVLVEENSKTIVISKADNYLDLLNSQFIEDSSFKNARSIVYSNINTNTSKYTITLDSSIESKIEIEFDKSNFKLKRIYIVYSDLEEDEEGNEKEKSLEVNYLTFNTDIPIEDSYFETTKYLIKKGKKYYLTSKYSNYTLVNLINKEK